MAFDLFLWRITPEACIWLEISFVCVIMLLIHCCVRVILVVGKVIIKTSFYLVLLLLKVAQETYELFFTGTSFSCGQLAELVYSTSLKSRSCLHIMLYFMSEAH